MSPTINTINDTRQRTFLPVRKPFDQWTLADARLALAWIIGRRVGSEGFQANWAYAEDKDHFQGGDGWVGPLGGDDRERSSRVLGAVERQFTPMDVIGEVLDNLANALLQHRAKVGLLPKKPADPGTPEEKVQQEQADELLRHINDWMEDQFFWQRAREAVKRSRWAGWGTMRVWIPEDAVEPDQSDEGEVATDNTGAGGMIGAAVNRVKALLGAGQEVVSDAPDRGEAMTTLPLPTGLSLEEALGMIFLSAPPPDQGFVYIDPDSQRRVGVFLYQDDRDQYAELCWKDANGETVSKVVSLRAASGNGASPTQGETDEARQDLGGVLPMAQMLAELLVTEPVRMQQAQLNFGNSILTRNMETAGFAERYIGNAEPEGEWRTTAPGVGETPAIRTADVNGMTWYLIPSATRTLGHSITTELRGEQDTDKDGNRTTLTPFVQKLDPTDPAYIIAACKAARTTILRQCKQGHLDMEGDATASAISRVQSRASHLADVSNMREPLQGMLQGVLEAALGYAALMSDDARKLLDQFRVTVTVHIFLGPVTPEEQKIILDRYTAGALSLPSTLQLLQIEDVQAEIDRIRSQPESRLQTLKGQAQIMADLVQRCGMSAELAAELVELSKEQIDTIKRYAKEDAAAALLAAEYGLRTGLAVARVQPTPGETAPPPPPQKPVPGAPATPQQPAPPAIPPGPAQPKTGQRPPQAAGKPTGG